MGRDDFKIVRSSLPIILPLMILPSLLFSELDSGLSEDRTLARSG
jgi:hypothetical protein